MEDCLFCKIIKGEIPCNKIYEDDNVFVFLDINPVNKGHALVVPKKHSADLEEMDEEITKHVFVVAKKLAPKIMEAVQADGFNVVMNNKKAAGQLVFHTHVHIVPRFSNDGLKHWPGKKYENNDDKLILEKIKEKIST